MKYPPKLYAQALSELAARSLVTTEETRFVKNFFEVIKKNNDTHQLKKILEETEKLLRMKFGRRKVTIESAREITNLKIKFSAKSGSLSVGQAGASGGKNFLKPDDIVEEKINPELIAGMKIIVNDEMQFDGSLRKKLNTLFAKN